MVRIAKPLFDVALNTAAAEAQRAFWEQEIGLPFEERLMIGTDAWQYRYGLNGAVVKICAYPTVPELPLAATANF